ncbi:hypothetical protein NPIL_572321 [Nephila pilipes]|uniref:Uncharacterized protein n=1 Tax=Nephila pilipes TaxID=299642 RepID=A0A8X6U5V8_NEPPI|nr:hypothetical protein NPIL_572321 [Nephila pilipes]
MYVYILLTLSFFAAVGFAQDSMVTCIHQKFSRDLGESYTTCHQRSGATAIPRIKQVKVATNGQMTVDRSKFATEGTSNTPVGKAVKACATNADDRMYQEVII